MNRKDEIRQKLFPTVMVPKFEHLTPCPINQSRLLIGSTGLFLESVMPWGRIVTQLWENHRSVNLPYGDVEEYYEDFFGVLDTIAPIISKEMVPRAAEYAKKDSEWAGWVVYDGSSFSYMPVDFEASADHARVVWPDLPGYSLAADVHSHGQGRSFFSPDDNKDDSGGVRICIVLGDYKEVHGHAFFTYKVRFVIEGFFVNVNHNKEGWFIKK